MTLPQISTELLVLGFVALLVVAFLSARGGRKGARGAPYPYVATPTLFTPSEQVFLRALEGAVDGHHKVFGKVRVTDLIGVRKGLSGSERQRALNRISQKHLDFVICHAEDTSVVCAVELDDSTHGRADRRARDAFLEGALKAAGVPLLRVPVRHGYDALELQTALASVQAPTPAATPPHPPTARRGST